MRVRKLGYLVFALCSLRAMGGESGYVPAVVGEDIAPTPLTMPREVAVEGEPRETVGHPCTLWDQEDIGAIKVRLKSDKEMQDKLARLVSAMDRRITEPLGIPDAGSAPPTRQDYRQHAANSEAIANLGIVYALTGEAKYGEFCKKMVVAYAKVYPQLPHPEGWTRKRYRSAQDGRLTGQFLEDGFWLARVAFGADLVHDLPSWTEDERKRVREDLFAAISATFCDPVIAAGPKERDYIDSTHNRSALCTSAVLMAGYACDDAKLVSLALYGKNGTPSKPTGGVFGTHFTEQCIFPDGLWNEGAPAYQAGITSCALMNDAETCWHHGMDLYRYRDGMLKRFLDSAIGLAYPTPKLAVPALHDSAPFSLLDDRDWFSNEAGAPYEYGYRRYRDPAYVPIVKNACKQFSMTVHAGPPSLFIDTPPLDQLPPRTIESANYFAVGYGVLRLPAAGGWNQLLMEFGPSGSHGHPSKLGLDVFALGEPLMPFPGVIFPYNDPMDPKWYWTTLANCALTVDEKPQVTWGNLWRYPRGTPNPSAQQTVFGPSATMGIQRAWSDTLYDFRLVQDRSLFLARHYFADLYLATGDTPRTFDLAWHFRGSIASSTLTMNSYAFPQPVQNGYNALTEVMRASTGSQPWSMKVTAPGGKPLTFLSAGLAETDVIQGKGHFFFNSPKNDEFPPTVIQRCGGRKSVLFGSVADISGSASGFVRKVSEEGGVERGFGLLKVETVEGTDLCFVSYRPGAYKAAELETDAVQAYAVRAGAEIRSLYLAGGSRLAVGGASIARKTPGLAYVERLGSGDWVVGNPSSADAFLSIAVPGLDKLEAFASDADGKRLGAFPVARNPTSGSVALTLKAGGRVVFSGRSLSRPPVNP